MIMMEWSNDVIKVSSNIKEARRNYYPPTTTTTTISSSHFPRNNSNRKQQQYFSLTNIIFFWFLIAVWHSPKYVANGLPLVLTSAGPQAPEDVILDSVIILRGDHVVPKLPPWHWRLNQNENMLIRDEDDVEDNDNLQEATGLGKHNNNELMETVVRPRKKKGLSYLTKYYTEAFLNNTPSTNGGSSNANSSAQSHNDGSSSFFGVSNGGGFGSSREQRFPSSVRRKLSFHPPMTSNSAFMRPWSGFPGSRAASGGRSPTMRLRWGK